MRYPCSGIWVRDILTMTVTLCNSPKSDNVSRAYLAKSLSSEQSYYNGLTKKAYSCATVELGQPLRIQASIKSLLGYNYGWIDYGDSMRYYFSITDYSMVSESMTDIIYELDPLATAYNQIGISIPRATLRRFNGEEPDINNPNQQYYGKYSVPYNPMFWKVTDYVTHEPKWYAFVIHNSSDNLLYSGLIRNNSLSANLDYLFSGGWLSILFGDTYQLSDVANFVYVPCDIEIATEPSKSASGMDAWIFQGDGRFNVKYSGFSTLESTPTKKDVLLDARGNIVYECAIGKKLSIEKGFLALTVSTISINLFCKQVISTFPSSEKPIEPEIITIPCETIDVYVDAWAEYAYRQRDYDNQIRQINAKSSLANIGNSAVSGAVAGAVTGSIVPGIGTAIGAVGGLAVGAVSSAVGTGIQYHYGNEQQKVTDAMYQKAQDTLSLVGNCSQSLILDTSNIIKATLEFDTLTLGNYLNDVATNGYYYDSVVSDFDPSTTTKTKYAITADIEVQGPIPTAWKDAIANRFANGLVVEHD